MTCSKNYDVKMMHTHSHKRTHYYTRTLLTAFWNHGKMVSNTPLVLSKQTARLSIQAPLLQGKTTTKCSRERIQGGPKMGCLAHITIKKCTLYPDSLQPHECGKSTIRTLKENKWQHLRLVT